MLGAPPSHGQVQAEYFRPHPCATDRGGPATGSVCEAEVPLLLSLQRNTLAGGVLRQRGVYDVLSVACASSGVALDAGGLVVAAQDRLSAASGAGDPFPIVMYAAGDNGTRSVLSGEAALLSLGRGVLADPSWLGAAFPGGLRGSVRLLMRMEREGSAVTRTTWSLRNGTPAKNSSRWLQEVAKTLCAPPTASFVIDAGLCDGLPPRVVAALGPFRADGRPVAASLGLADGQFAGWPEMRTQWHTNRPGKPVTEPGCPPLDGVRYEAITPAQPLWLLGRGDRELHVAGPAAGRVEVELARRLLTCAYRVTRRDLDFVVWILDDAGLPAQLAQRYRRDNFRTDPPEPPVSDAGLLLAALVVMPKAAAIVLLLLQQRRRGRPPPRRSRCYWREGASRALVLAAGAAALAGVGYLDRVERAGHAWRAAAVRHSRRIAANETEERTARAMDYRRRLATDNETLLVVARTGYRPHLTRRLLVGSIAPYVVLAATVLVKAAAATRRQRRLPDGGGTAGDTPVVCHLWWPWAARVPPRPASEEAEPPVNGGGDRNGIGDGSGGDGVSGGGWYGDDWMAAVSQLACPPPATRGPPSPLRLFPPLTLTAGHDVGGAQGRERRQQQGL